MAKCVKNTDGIPETWIPISVKLTLAKMIAPASFNLETITASSEKNNKQTRSQCNTNRLKSEQTGDRFKVRTTFASSVSFNV